MEASRNEPHSHGATSRAANSRATPGQICTTVVPLPADLVERDRRRRLAMRVVDLSGIAPVVAARIVPAGLEVDQSVPAGAHPAVSCTTSQQALDLLAPAARGLALLHDAGLVHGPGAALWVDLDGAGVLVGWSGQGDPAADVAEFAALAFKVLPAGAMGSDVVQALVLAGDPDPQVRPTASRLATVFDAARRREAVPAVSGAAHVPGTPAPALPTSPAAVRRSVGVWGGADDEVPAIGGSPFIPRPWGAWSESRADSRAESAAESPGEPPAASRTRHRRAESPRGWLRRPPRLLAGLVGGVVVLGLAWVAWPSAADHTPMCPLTPGAAVVDQSPNTDEPISAEPREKKSKPRAKKARE